MGSLNSRLLACDVEETSDGLIVLARIDARASEEEVQAICSEIARLSVPEVEALSIRLDPPHYLSLRSSVHRLLMTTDSQSPTGTHTTREPSLPVSVAVDADDLIPVAPDRRRGKISVQLKKTGRDRPLPAENPWAE